MSGIRAAWFARAFSLLAVLVIAVMPVDVSKGGDVPADCKVTFRELANALEIGEDAVIKLKFDVARARSKNKLSKQESAKERARFAERAEFVDRYDEAVVRLRAEKVQQAKDAGDSVAVLKAYMDRVNREQKRVVSSRSENKLVIKEGRVYADFNSQFGGDAEYRKLVLDVVRQNKMAEVRVGDIDTAKDLSYLFELQKAAPENAPVRVQGLIYPSRLNREMFLGKDKSKEERAAYKEAMDFFGVLEGCGKVWTRSLGDPSKCDVMRLDLWTNDPAKIKWLRRTYRPSGL